MPGNNTLRTREASLTNMDIRKIFAIPAPKAPGASRRTFLKISGGASAGPHHWPRRAFAVRIG